MKIDAKKDSAIHAAAIALADFRPGIARAVRKIRPSGVGAEQGASGLPEGNRPREIARPGAGSRKAHEQGMADECRVWKWAVKHVGRPSYIYSKP